MPKRLIITFDYLRKSTKGSRTDAGGHKRERQEKSISQQRSELDALHFPHELTLEGFAGYKIAGTFTDEGISGWKLGNKRPGFHAMIEAIKQHEAKEKVIRVDNLDRFSRANIDDTLDVARELKRAGVRWIVSAAEGVFHIQGGNDLAEHMKFAFAAHRSHDFSRQLSRRVSLARRNAAVEGKRTGGDAGYGFENDGKGSLKHGDPKKIKIVRELFQRFAEGWSLQALAGDLNERKVPGPDGGPWFVKTVGRLLRRRCYRGDFEYGLSRGGQFTSLDNKGEVVDKTKLDGVDGKIFIKKGIYEPIVEPEVFDRVQRRLEDLKKNRNRRKNTGFALTGGILVCDHCGSNLYGTHEHGENSIVIYRCSGNSKLGKSACPQYRVREDRILPFILKMIVQEIGDLKVSPPEPPEKLRKPYKERQEKRKQAEAERNELAAQIAKAEENILFIEDARTRQSLDKKITAWRNKLETMEEQMAMEPMPKEKYSLADLEAIHLWWDEFLTNAVHVPRNMFFDDPDNPDITRQLTMAVDPRKVNEALHEIGCQVRLRWETKKFRKEDGKEFTRHILVRGRFRLGQKKVNIPRYVLNRPARGRPRR